MALGIDLFALYQSVDDWAAVRDHGIIFVWVKITDGGGQATNPGDGLVAGAREAGIAAGGYHYAQLSPEPERQADTLIAEMLRVGATGLVPMLDLEAPFVPDAYAANFGQRFCSRIRQLGYRPGVYMSDSFAAALRPDTWDTNPVIWIANYSHRPTYGGHYDVHQYASDGQVPGIAASGVDMSESYTDAHFTAAQEDDMQLTDRWTDSYGNTQDVQTTLERLNELWYRFFGQGSVVAHDPSHTPTNLSDLITDMAAWTLGQGQQLSDLMAAIKGVQAGSVDVPALAAALEATLPEGIAQALGQRLIGESK